MRPPGMSAPRLQHDASKLLFFSGQSQRGLSGGGVRRSAAAEYNLGRFYERGVGVAQDCKTAAAWFAKAAAQGDTVAAARLDACLARVSAAGSRA